MVNVWLMMVNIWLIYGYIWFMMVKIWLKYSYRWPLMVHITGDNGSFQLAMGDTPIAEWFISWTVPNLKRMMTGGSPLTQETTI